MKKSELKKLIKECVIEEGAPKIKNDSKTSDQKQFNEYYTMVTDMAKKLDGILYFSKPINKAVFAKAHKADIALDSLRSALNKVRSGT